METRTTTGGRVRPDVRPTRLRPPVRKAVLTVHVLSASAWIGLDVMLGVLVFTGLWGGDAAVAALALQALPFAGTPILVAGLATLASGLALGWGTHLGLVRYWWVAVKLVLNVVLVALVTVLLLPGLEVAAAEGARLADGLAPREVSTLFMPPLVSGTALVLATVLSIFRPWGRTRGVSRRR